MPTESEFRNLTKNGETLDIEFKSERNKALSYGQLAEAVACLANRCSDQAGWLFVGVEDDGEVTGAQNRHNGTIQPGQVRSAINERLNPPQSLLVDVITVENRQVLAISVMPSPEAVGTTGGVYQRRDIDSHGKPVCLPHSPRQTISQESYFGVGDPTDQPLNGVGMDALDPLEIERYRETVRSHSPRSDVVLANMEPTELCRALHAIEQKNGKVQIRLLALLLFGREQALREYLPNHEVAFQRFKRLALESNEIVRWPLIKAFDHLQSLLMVLHSEEEMLIRLRRVGSPIYSPASVREAVANAFIHRDYVQPAAIHIQWRDDYWEVSSPGVFPQGINLNNYLRATPRYRNSLLVDAFKRAGLVERSGRGIQEIFSNQISIGRPRPEYLDNVPDGVRLQLPRGPVNWNLVQLIVNAQLDMHPLTANEILILYEAFKRERITLAQSQRALQLPGAQSVQVLQQLEDRDVLVRHGLDLESSEWTLAKPVPSQSSPFDAVSSPSLHDGTPTPSNGNSPPPPKSQSRPTPKRSTGSTPPSRLDIQKIISFVEDHGKIARRDVAELFDTTPQQAAQWLQYLVTHGTLYKHGEKRGTAYSLKR